MRLPPLNVISAHWSAASSALIGCSREKTEPSCWRKKRPVERLRQQRPDAAAQQLLPEGQARPLDDHAAVEEQRARQLDAQLAVDVAGEQLGRHRGAHVVGDQLTTGRRRRGGATSSSVRSACQASV